MTTLLLFGIAVILLFASAVGFGAPFLPTLKKRVEDALDLLDLKEGQTMLEFGSGDGRLLRAAANRKIHAVGYEINPLLYLYSKIVCFKKRKYITIHLKNYWKAQLPKADGIYVFLLQPYMSRLHRKLLLYLKEQHMQQIKLVSFSFYIEGQKPQKDSHGMLLYKISRKDDK